MYIQPNSTIRLLTGVPLDNTYAHTIYFANETAQAEYFASKTKPNCVFNNQTYQRVNRGTMRLQVLADNIYDCNYLMFKNTAYGNKWFYAFVTSIEYVSNIVSEITYEIDVMQTWFFDVTLLESFVEREHSATDVAGENIVPEPVNIGDYYMGVPSGTGFFTDFDVVVVSPYHIERGNTQWEPYYRYQKIDQNPTMLTHMVIKTVYTEQYEYEPFYIAFEGLSRQGLVDSVVDCYLIPRHFLPQYDNFYQLGENIDPKPMEYYRTKPTTLSHGYTPKNKKLLTYPYNKLVIDTGDGNLNEYCFEFFGHNDVDDRDDVVFNVYAYRGDSLSFKACPLRYKGEPVNYTESCLLTDFPPFPYIIDSFKAWIAQNKTRLALQVGTDILGIGAGMGTVMAGAKMLTPKTQVLSKAGAKMMGGGYEEMGQSGVRGVGGTLAELADRSVARFKPSGSSSGSLEIAMGKKDFTAIQYSVNPLNAQIIDDFFSVYGYATHRVKVPNRNVRPHWTFVKTIDINLEGNAPADDVKHICSIYDKGITFWRNASEVGNYSLDNSPS